jgi:hypothetical protein
MSFLGRGWLRSRPPISANAPGGLFVGVTRLVGEHSFFGAATSPAPLPAEFLDAGFFREHLPGPQLFNFVQQQPPGDESIKSLLARALALDLQAGRSMQQHHARRRFVDILPAMSARPHKSLLDIRIAHTQDGHPLGELLFLFHIHRKRGHAGSLAERIHNLKEPGIDR